MTADVRTLPGVQRPDQTADNQPQPKVVAILEQLLAEARSGELQGIAFAVVHAGLTTGDGWAVGDARADNIDHFMWAAVSDLFVRYGDMRRRRHDARDKSPPTPPQGG